MLPSAQEPVRGGPVTWMCSAVSSNLGSLLGVMQEHPQLASFGQCRQPPCPHPSTGDHVFSLLPK